MSYYKDHIGERAELSNDLDGLDKEVEKYFLSLPPEALKLVFKIYGHLYSYKAQSYAESTYPMWKSGLRSISGDVATRLFNILPPCMPLKTKYKMIERLWKKYCPSSERSFPIYYNMDVNLLMKEISNYINNIIESYEIPHCLQTKFEWLSHGDSVIKQQLLNHIMQIEKQIAYDSISKIISKTHHHLSSKHIEKLNYTETIGNHKIHLRLDKSLNCKARKP